MVTNDRGLVSYKHLVMEEVARLAWNDELDNEHLEQKVEELIPGPSGAEGRGTDSRPEADLSLLHI